MEVSRENIAIENFRSGFNCAQSVLSAFSNKYNLDGELALKLTSGMGSGFRSGEVCGVVSGATIVIGLKYGQCEASDIESKQRCYSKTEEFIHMFRKRDGSILCKELIGCDLTTDYGREKAKQENLFTTICEEKIRHAVSLLEELGY